MEMTLTGRLLEAVKPPAESRIYTIGETLRLSGMEKSGIN